MKILISEPLSPFIIDEYLKLENIVFNPHWFEERTESEATILITRNLTKVDEKILNYLPQLKVVVVYGVGSDHVDPNFINQKKIKLIKGTDENAQSTAEFTIMLMLAALRKYPNAQRVIAQKN